MAALSVVLGVLSLACVVVGALLTLVPVLGALFSFGAPALAIAGIIVGGLAMSRHRQARAAMGAAVSGDREPVAPSNALAVAGVITSALALLPALLTALTCGLCNALVSSGRIQTRRDFQIDVQRGSSFPAPRDAGSEAPASSPAPPASDAAAESEAPAPAFPPPPLDSDAPRHHRD